jgi:dephospho-CoA kinase
VYVVGLTGPLGAGKSSVLQMLHELGAQTLRADDASRELLSRDSCLLSEIRTRLGSDLFRPDGSLDRARTAALIFADAQARRTLEQITHPPMVQWLRQRLDGLRTSCRPPAIAVVEAAILTHMGARSLVDCVVRVDAPYDVRRARLQARDGISGEEAERRLRLQEEMGLSVEAADYVLDTSGSLDETRGRVKALWDVLLARHRSAPDSTATTTARYFGPVALRLTGHERRRWRCEARVALWTCDGYS